jgi:hypothetical protein
VNRLAQLTEVAATAKRFIARVDTVAEKNEHKKVSHPSCHPVKKHGSWAPPRPLTNTIPNLYCPPRGSDQRPAASDQQQRGFFSSSLTLI